MQQDVGICDICFRRFYSFKKLIKHWGKMHPEIITIKCCFCKNITMEESYAKHKDDFHFKLKMACQFCFYTTRKWHRLKKHHKKCHVAVEEETVSSPNMEFKTDQQTNLIPEMVDVERHCPKSQEPEQLEMAGKVKNETNVDPFNSDLMQSVGELVCDGKVKNKTHVDKSDLMQSVGELVCDGKVKNKTHVDKSDLMQSVWELVCDGKVKNKTHVAKSDLMQSVGELVCDGKVKNKTHVDKSDLMQSVWELVCDGKELPAVESFVCDVCQKSLTCVKHLSMHMLVHKPLRSFICDHCDRWFNEPDDYDLHIGTHFKCMHRPFICTYCKKSYITKSNLLVHTRRHTGDLKYKCPQCKYAASQICDLKNHLRIHSNERPFKCTVCEYSAHKKSTLIHHTRSHTGEKPFCCKVCGRKFSIRSSLISHRNRVHLA
ncbi:zinc finger protein 271-like [Physella acuta]|uniref:zinc finger protein 271-like n=1 Tax=Physella acuta TaxID=109671 RepID=UPI0027DE1FBE|nr:zinc finger protein 271-like [Physella acuta]